MNNNHPETEVTSLLQSQEIVGPSASEKSVSLILIILIDTNGICYILQHKEGGGDVKETWILFIQILVFNIQ